MPSRRLLQLGLLRLLAGLALLLILNLPALADPGAALGRAKAELSTLLTCLETALAEAPAGPADSLAPFESQVAAAWLSGDEGPVDLELARRRCRPRYEALAQAYAALVTSLDAAATERAVRIYERRVLPRALEISICLLAAESALANEGAAPSAGPGGDGQ